MKNYRFQLAVIVIVGILLLFSACSAATTTTPSGTTPVSSPSRQPTETGSSSPTPAPSAYTVNIASSPLLGQYLVDGEGITLYWTTADLPGQSNVPDNLLTVWPVFYAPTTVVPSSLDAANFGTISRSNGALQTTFKDWPLYYYSNDSSPGQAGGQGIAGRWSVVNPGASAPQPVPSSPSSPTTSPSSVPPPTSSASPPPTSSQPPSSSTTSSPTPTSSGVIIDLIAHNLAFNISTIAVSAGDQVTINFDNQDSGIPHSFSVYTDSSATTSIFVGQVVNGPGVATYTFTAPQTPGTYFFRCEVHPTIMTGTFVVNP